MNAIKTIKRLLEDLYRLYNYGNNGEMIVIDELDCFIYKGKELHYDQNLIMYSSSDGTIKIDGIEEDNSIINKSYIKIKENEEVKFDALNENSVEFNFLNNVIVKINNKLKSNGIDSTPEEEKNNSVNLSLVDRPIISESDELVYTNAFTKVNAPRDGYLVKSRSIYGRKNN